MAPYAAAAAPPLVPQMPAAVASMDYAQWSTRVFGYLIDTVVVGVIVGALLVVLMLLGGLGSLAGAGVGVGQGVGGLGCCLAFSIFPLGSLAVGLYNKVFLVAQRGASIGQGIMHIKVVNAQGGLLTPSQALVRLLAHVGLSFIPFGGIVDLAWPLWDERRQTLHDKAVDCYVVNAR